MNILAVDTSASWGSVAVSHKERICYISYLDIRVTHSERLMIQIDDSLSRSGLTLDKIDLIVFSNGPGSFTGLRIGLAAVKGICTAREIPVYPVNSLLALAYNVYGTDKNIAPFVDARMNEVYAALYDKDMNELISPVNTDPEEFLNSIDSETLILGDGVYKYSHTIHQKNNLLKKGLIHQNYIIASSLIAIAGSIGEGNGMAKWRNTTSPPRHLTTSPFLRNVSKEYQYDFEAIADLEPYYLRKSQAEINRNAKDK